MADKRQLEFFILRYMPDAIKEEFVNIGVLMIESGVNGSGFADVSFTKDWRRLHCLDPQADIEVLQALEREIRTQLRVENDRAALLKRIHDSFSNLIQVSPVKACLAEQPAQELARLAKLYMESPARGGPRLLAGRQHILGTMREAFELANVWDLLMHGVPVAPYTKPGDPFKFDFGYRVGNTIKLFHAASLKSSVEQAVMLAARYPAIASGMNQNLKAAPFLTAIVDDDLDRADERIDFALGMMKEANIKVAAAAEMPGIAETARLELRV